MFVLPILCSLLKCQAAHLGSEVYIKGLESTGCLPDTPFLSLVKSYHLSVQEEVGREEKTLEKQLKERRHSQTWKGKEISMSQR